MSKKKRVGQILPANTMFLRAHAGEASLNGKVLYDFSTGLPSGAPIVRSAVTGKWFTLSWSDLIELAQEAGIDTEQEAAAAQDEKAKP